MQSLISATSGGTAAGLSALLLDSAMDAIVTADEEQRIVMYNQAAERIFGWPAKEVIGAPLTKLIPQRFRAHHAEHVRNFGATGVTSRRMGGSAVVYARRASGEEFPVDASISQLDTSEGKLFTVILRDATERVRAQQEQQRLTARLSGLLDSAMDGIIAIDESQLITLYNPAAEKIFGWPADQVIGQPLTKLIPQRFHGSHAEHVRRFGATGVTSRRMGGSAVVYGRRSTGEEFPVDASISQLDTPDGKVFTVILRDVTQRVEAEHEQARLAARLSGLLDSAMDGIITVDEGQRVIMYNRAAEKIFGWTSAEMMGEPLSKLLPQRFRGGHDAYVRRFGATGVTSRRMGDRTVIHGRRKDGEEFPLDASISQLDTAEGKLFTVILRDVTERVRAQDELAAFAAEASNIREQEKTRIARELHDELAQSLTALKMDAMWLGDHLDAGPGALAEKLRGMLAMLDSSVAATRRIAADLRPLMLDDLGLVPAIEWLAQNFTQRSGVPCKLEIDENLELEEPYATAVFRMVQESLVNVAKHARATQVRVGVSVAPDEVALWVIDDGVGFDAGAPRKQNSLGLAGLRERAHLLKGTVSVDSGAGRGTRVEARLPVRH
ncbi:PAS domain-containing sensor histidine kinase [Caenimonas aquaedulcis]|uniref:histidine kinase n=1 Tax=Caenimonas aquaedulcis TaxID=2793270 RepID=A0A931H8D7_9BURK|nr:PAS domain S-box protein [Caenimonas aquaedulcis]MBG9390233.1 PAS domain S-box protein [Caenimonas aquaedulcis]